eukprot:1159801-Pelagomonas_calceolata.AAC.3
MFIAERPDVDDHARIARACARTHTHTHAPGCWCSPPPLRSSVAVICSAPVAGPATPAPLLTSPLMLSLLLMSVSTITIIINIIININDHGGAAQGPATGVGGRPPSALAVCSRCARGCALPAAAHSPSSRGCRHVQRCSWWCIVVGAEELLMEGQQEALVCSHSFAQRDSWAQLLLLDVASTGRAERDAVGTDLKVQVLADACRATAQAGRQGCIVVRDGVHDIAFMEWRSQ